MTDPDELHTGAPPSDGNVEHHAVQVTNMPPTEIICKCGARFVGGDVIGKMKAHMDGEQSGRAT